MTYKVPKNNAYSTLASGIDDVALSLSVAAGEGVRFPDTFPFHITIDSEILECTNRAVDTLTVTRSAESTSAATHDAGAAVRLNITAEAITELQTAAPEGHAAAVLSSTVHGCDMLCRAAIVADQSAIPNNKYARVELNNVASPGFDLGSNFKSGYVLGAAGAYRQADADSTSTKIEDDDAAFTTVAGKTNALRYALVNWSSDAAGTLNTGSGYVTAVTDADTLTIYKTAGANFAASYYYAIKQAWFLVPATGIYPVGGMIYYSSTSMVANKSVGAAIVVNGSIATQLVLHTALIDYINVPIPMFGVSL
nr:hypothetical protein [Dehalococcoidales bacterium]